MKFFFFGLILLAAPLFAQSEHTGPSKILPLPAPLQAEHIPWFVARAADGTTLTTLNDLKKTILPTTQRVVFAYFATWCVPCRAGMVRLRDASDSLAAHNVQVFAVNVMENDGEAIIAWQQQFANPNWTLVRDLFGQLSVKYGMAKQDEPIPLPQTLVLTPALKPIQLIGVEGDDWPQLIWQIPNPAPIPAPIPAPSL